MKKSGNLSRMAGWVDGRVNAWWKRGSPDSESESREWISFIWEGQSKKSMIMIMMEMTISLMTRMVQ